MFKKELNELKRLKELKLSKWSSVPLQTKCFRFEVGSVIKFLYIAIN